MTLISLTSYLDHISRKSYESVRNTGAGPAKNPFSWACSCVSFSNRKFYDFKAEVAVYFRTSTTARYSTGMLIASVITA